MHVRAAARALACRRRSSVGARVCGGRAPAPRHGVAPWRATSAGRGRGLRASSCDPPQNADNATENRRLARPDRLEFFVLGLEADVVRLLEVALDRRLLADESDDDLSITRRVAALDDDVIAVEDAGVLHRVAGHAQDVLAAVAADQVRDVDVLLDVLLGQDRRAGRDTADERQARWLDDLLRTLDEELERPRFRRVPAHQADLLEVREVGVD